MSAWRGPPLAPGLEAGAVHVWRASLRQPGMTLARLASVLSEDERARAARLRTTQLRADFEASRGIQRDVLARYTGIPAESLAFDYTSFGKPSLVETGRAPGLVFNVSNAGGMALVALTLEQRIGADLEPVRPVRQALAIAGRFFSKNEAEILRTFPNDDVDRAFLTVWTRKEAFIKAVGEGLSLPLGDFDVSCAPGEAAKLLRTRPVDTAERWTLREVAPAPGFIGCIALEGELRSLDLYDWRPGATHG